MILLDCKKVELWKPCYELLRRLVGSTEQAYSELHENQWNDLLFFEIVPSHYFRASEANL